MWYFLILAIFSFAAFERFYRVTEIGLYGSDVFFYFETAKRYLAGEFVATEHFRPLAYALYALAMKAGGVNFYSIKVLNGILDMLNIVVILLLSMKVLRNRWWALVPTFLYVMLATPAIQSRTELLHVPSTLPLLLCCLLMTYAFDRWSEKSAQVLLFAAGACFGLASNLHPSLNLLAPLFACTILGFIFLRTNENHEFKQSIIRTMIFAGGFIAVYIFTFSLIGFQNGWQAFTGNQSKQSGSSLSLIENIYWSFRYFVSGNSSEVLMACIYGLGLFWIWRGGLRQRHFFYTMTLILGAGYAVLYSVLVPKFQLVRTFLPLMPLLLIFATAAYKDLISKNKWNAYIGAALLGFCIFSLRPDRSFWPMSVYEPVSITYAVYQSMQSAWTQDDRVLILPLITYGDRKPFSQPSYFGPQAQYVIESPEANLKDLLNPNTTVWVVLLKDGLDFAIPNDFQRSRKEFEKQLVKYLNIEPENYSFDQEAQFWETQAPLHGYKPFAQTDRFVIFKRGEK